MSFTPTPVKNSIVEPNTLDTLTNSACVISLIKECCMSHEATEFNLSDESRTGLCIVLTMLENALHFETDKLSEEARKEV